MQSQKNQYTRQALSVNFNKTGYLLELVGLFISIVFIAAAYYFVSTPTVYSSECFRSKINIANIEVLSRQNTEATCYFDFSHISNEDDSLLIYLTSLHEEYRNDMGVLFNDTFDDNNNHRYEIINVNDSRAWLATGTVSGVEQDLYVFDAGPRGIRAGGSHLLLLTENTNKSGLVGEFLSNLEIL